MRCTEAGYMPAEVLPAYQLSVVCTQLDLPNFRYVDSRNDNKFLSSDYHRDAMVRLILERS